MVYRNRSNIIQYRFGEEDGDCDGTCVTGGCPGKPLQSEEG